MCEGTKRRKRPRDICVRQLVIYRSFVYLFKSNHRPQGFNSSFIIHNSSLAMRVVDVVEVLGVLDFPAPLHSVPRGGEGHTHRALYPNFLKGLRRIFHESHDLARCSYCKITSRAKRVQQSTFNCKRSELTTATTSLWHISVLRQRALTCRQG